jgi:hypothetical protein
LRPPVDGLSSGVVSNNSNPISDLPGLRLRSANNPDGPALRELIFGILRKHQLDPDP